MVSSNFDFGLSMGSLGERSCPRIHHFFWRTTHNCFHKTSYNSRSIWRTDVRGCLLERLRTTECMCFVRIPIDGVTSPSWENKHQFWDNLCTYRYILYWYKSFSKISINSVCTSWLSILQPTNKKILIGTRWCRLILVYIFWKNIIQLQDM